MMFELKFSAKIEGESYYAKKMRFQYTYIHADLQVVEYQCTKRMFLHVYWYVGMYIKYT